MNAVVDMAQHRPALTLTEQQAAAYSAAVDFAIGKHGAKMMTLEGYAGTGKTFLIGELIRSLDGLHRVAIAAPTNKAVSVLLEKIGNKTQAVFGSVHSFLGLRLKEKEDGNHECVAEGASTVHEYDLMVVDECSMVSRDLFARLAQAANHSGTRILFVGDPAQLPPVENDADTSATFSHVEHKSRLTEVVRQAKGNPIIALSMDIRAAIAVGERMTSARIADSLPAPPADVLFAYGGADTAKEWALDSIRSGFKDTRILAYRNVTVLAYNADIHAELHGHALPFTPGEVLMMQEAHEFRAWKPGSIAGQLANSEEVTLRKIESGYHPKFNTLPAWQMVVERDTGEHVTIYSPIDARAHQAEISRMFGEAAQIRAGLARQRDSAKDEERKKLQSRGWALRNSFANVRHTYALTIHKSQGSTLHTAIVDLSDVERMRDDFQYNRALYVATTRAAHRLAFVA